jgi:hypothetical protein
MRRDLRYTPNTVFDSFPWPQAPTEETVAAMVDAAAEIMRYRVEHAEQGLGVLYDSLREPGRNPLRDLHDELDRAVLAVYGFDPSEGLLAQLLALNQSIASEAEQGTTEPRGPGSTGIDGARKSQEMITAPGLATSGSPAG